MKIWGIFRSNLKNEKRLFTFSVETSFQHAIGVLISMNVIWPPARFSSLSNDTERVISTHDAKIWRILLIICSYTLNNNSNHTTSCYCQHDNKTKKSKKNLNSVSWSRTSIFRRKIVHKKDLICWDAKFSMNYKTLYLHRLHKSRFLKCYQFSMEKYPCDINDTQ